MSMPGETYVCWVESPVLPLLPALAARGIPSTSTAAIIVTRPRPPLPQSAFERESSLLPVPQSALERLWPRLPPFLSIAILPLTRRGGSAFPQERAAWRRRADRIRRNVFGRWPWNIPRLGEGRLVSLIRVIERSGGTVGPVKPLVVGHLFPDYLNIYADRGNIAVLRARAAWRGYELEVESLGAGAEIRRGEHDLFYVGGGQDREQALIAPELAALGPALHEAFEAGAAFLAVCGGYQL